MRSFITRNFDIIASLAFLLFCIAVTAPDAFPQSSTTLQRKCPGASPSPPYAKVDVEKDGDVQLTPCSGRSIFINSDTTSGLITSINGLTAASQTFAAPTANDTASWSSTTATHTLRLPITGVSGASRTTFFPYFNAQNTLAKSPLSLITDVLYMDLSTNDCTFCFSMKPSKLGAGAFQLGIFAGTPNYLTIGEGSGLGTFRTSGVMTIWGGTSATVKSDSGVTNLPDATINFGAATAKGVLSLDASKNFVSTALTNGQLLVGSTGAVPVAATITAGSGIAITNAAGSITIGADPNLRSYLASTVTYNNTAALANTALSVTVAASGTYDVELTVHSTSVTRALNMDFGGTATFTNFIGQWEGQPAAGFADPTDGVGARVTAAGTDFSTSVADAKDEYYTFKGTAEINGAGTFLLRGAQRAADASNTTILRGSTLILRKLN